MKNNKLRIEIAKGDSPPEGTISGGTDTCLKCRNAVEESYTKNAIRKYVNGDESLTELRLLVAVIKTVGGRDFRPVNNEDEVLLLKQKIN